MSIFLFTNIPLLVQPHVFNICIFGADDVVVVCIIFFTVAQEIPRDLRFYLSVSVCVWGGGGGGACVKIIIIVKLDNYLQGRNSNNYIFNNNNNKNIFRMMFFFFEKNNLILFSPQHLTR